MSEILQPIRRMLNHRQLKERGITWSQGYISHLEEEGQFPRRVKLGERGRVAWVESEIEEWLHDRIAARDADAAQKRRRIWRPNLGRLTPRENTA